MPKTAHSSVTDFELASCSPYALASWCIIILLLVATFPPLYFSILRISADYPINFAYNEGWNVIHAANFLKGEPLYVSLDRFPLTPVNYPPLSFVIVAGLSYLFRSILLTGRIVAFASFLFASFLVYKIVRHITGLRLAALLGAAVWLSLVTHLALIYVGYDDPQLLAHAFSLSALFLFVRWEENLDRKRTWTIALLCCLALLTKHLVIAIPLSIAMSLLYRCRWKEVFTFAFAGFAIGSLFLLAMYVYRGTAFFSNFLDTARPVTAAGWWWSTTDLFVYNFGAVLFIPFAYLCRAEQKTPVPVLVYFLASLILGSYTSAGVGVSINAWFDFFLAASIVYGLFAAIEPGLTPQAWFKPLAFGLILCALSANEFLIARYLKADGIHEPTVTIVRLFQVTLLVAGSALLVSKYCSRTLKVALFCAILSTSCFPLVVTLSERIHLNSALNELGQNEKLYQSDVEFVKSITGPALFENPLLGYDAGKEFLFDPFAASQLMVARRIPEELLLRRIQEKYFRVIALSRDLHETVEGLQASPWVGGAPRTTVSDRWTDSALLAMDANYHRVTSHQREQFFFYAPDDDHASIRKEETRTQ